MDHLLRLLARDGVPLRSVGASLMVILPSAFVSLSPMLQELSAIKRMRVISAGAWHNVVLCLAMYLLAFVPGQHFWNLVGYDDIGSRGVVVHGIDSVSLF